MRLHKLQEAATWIDPFGDAHRSLVKYCRLLETVEVEATGEFVRLQRTGVGVAEPFDATIFAEAGSDRTWIELPIIPGVYAYRPRFKEPRDLSLAQHEVGSSTAWVDDAELANRRLVNEHGRAVDREGNPL